MDKKPTDSNEPTNHPDEIRPWVDPKLEARVVADVLGESSDFEKAEMEQALEADPELAVFKRRMKAIDGLLGESLGGSPQAAEWRLAPDRRKALIEVFNKASGDPDAGETKTAPSGEPRSRRKRLLWIGGLGGLSAAAAIVLVLTVSSLFIAKRSKLEAVAVARPQENQAPGVYQRLKGNDSDHRFYRYGESDEASRPQLALTDASDSVPEASAEPAAVEPLYDSFDGLENLIAQVEQPRSSGRRGSLSPQALGEENTPSSSTSTPASPPAPGQPQKPVTGPTVPAVDLEDLAVLGKNGLGENGDMSNPKPPAAPAPSAAPARANPRKSFVESVIPEGEMEGLGYVGEADAPALPALIDEKTAAKNVATNAAFSPDGKTLASAGSDGTIKLWNQAGELVATEPGTSGNGSDIAITSKFVETSRVRTPELLGVDPVVAQGDREGTSKAGGETTLAERAQQGQDQGQDQGQAQSNGLLAGAEGRGRGGRSSGDKLNRLADSDGDGINLVDGQPASVSGLGTHDENSNGKPRSASQSVEGWAIPADSMSLGKITSKSSITSVSGRESQREVTREFIRPTEYAAPQIGETKGEAGADVGLAESAQPYYLRRQGLQEQAGDPATSQQSQLLTGGAQLLDTNIDFEDALPELATEPLAVGLDSNSKQASDLSGVSRGKHVPEITGDFDTGVGNASDLSVSNRATRDTSIVINEVMAGSPSDSSNADYIELYNRGTATVDGLSALPTGEAKKLSISEITATDAPSIAPPPGPSDGPVAEEEPKSPGGESLNEAGDSLQIPLVKGDEFGFFQLADDVGYDSQPPADSAGESSGDRGVGQVTSSTAVGEEALWGITPGISTGGSQSGPVAAAAETGFEKDAIDGEASDGFIPQTDNQTRWASQAGAIRLNPKGGNTAGKELYFKYSADGAAKNGDIDLARARASNGEYDAAREILEKQVADDPGDSKAKTLLGQLDDPDRFPPALTPEHVKNVREVERKLREGAGYYDLGEYDKAKEAFGDVLTIDKHNTAAKGMIAKTDRTVTTHLRSARDHMRSDLLRQVDEQWQVPVPNVALLGGDGTSPDDLEPAAEVAESRREVEIVPSATDTDGYKDVNITLNEKNTGKLSFGAGFSSLDDLNGFIDVTESNVDLAIKERGSLEDPFSWEEQDSETGKKQLVMQSRMSELQAEQEISTLETHFRELSDLEGEQLIEQAAALNIVDDTFTSLFPERQKLKEERANLVALRRTADDPDVQDVDTRLGDVNQILEQGAVAVKNSLETRLDIAKKSLENLEGVDHAALAAPSGKANREIVRRQQRIVNAEESAKRGQELAATGNFARAELEIREALEILPKADTTEEKRLGFEEQLGAVQRELKLAKERELTRTFAPVTTDEKLASAEAFSTFSLHVSDVAFKLAQAALAKGEWPEPEKVRVEEFVNAFDYGDPSPAPGEKVSCHVEQCAHPSMQQRNLLRISVRTAAVGRGSGQPLRLTIMLDNSGSMQREDREASVQRAMAVLADQLQPNDEVSLVGFARTPRLLADRINGSDAAKLLAAVKATPSEGGTNLEEALRVAAEVAERQFSDGAVNRIVLITDGAANLGDADPEALAKRVVELRQRGVAFDACGVGAKGLNDQVLEALTRKGDGRYYFLDSPDQADSGFASQLAGALRPAAKNVKVQVVFNPDRVGAYRLFGFEKHRLKKEDFRNDAVDAAEMAAEEAGVALYQVEPMADGRGDIGEVRVRFQDVTTGKMIEHSWIIPYEEDAATFDKSKPSMKLAGTAALLGEHLRGGPQASNVNLDVLSGVGADLRSAFGGNVRVNQLVEMVNQARNAK
jgi:tetratricopeptide (TPR) repeat protein